MSHGSDVETPDSRPATEPLVAGAKVDEVLPISPLSIQAASLVRSIDALSRIFWISLAGTFMTLFFAGLSQLAVNASSEFIALGEYQVPKSIVPLAALLFAVFVFWLTANRLRMLAYVLRRSHLPETTVDEIFRLNPPVLNVFDEDNEHRWSPFNGVSVLVINWAVFFGNALALTLFSTIERGAASAEFDFLQLGLVILATMLILVYAVRNVFPPLREILSRLHGLDFHIGWPRKLGGIALILSVVAAQHVNQIIDPAEQADNLLGPAFANAIDGETLFIRGVEVKLYGIDAVERDQTCQDGSGKDYACGRAAVQALQERIHNRDVLCVPFYTVSSQRILGTCAVQDKSRPMPTNPIDFWEIYPYEGLSRIQVELGHALWVGAGEQRFEEEQNQAQTLRLGIWQGSFLPPALWRAQHLP